MPVRVYDIAKKLGVESKEVISIAKELGFFSAKVPSSSLDVESGSRLENAILKGRPDLAVKQAPIYPGHTQLITNSLNEKQQGHSAKPQPAPETLSRVEKIMSGGAEQPSASAPNRRLVIPLRNREQNFFEISPWFLADSVRIEQISDEDYATLHREETEIFRPIVTPHSQCLIVALSGLDIEQAAYEATAKAQFVFKTFSSTPLILSHAAVILAPHGEKPSVEKSLALPIWGDYGQFLSAPFAFVDAVNPEKVAHFFKILTTAINKHPGLLITLSRFNSCWLRSTDHDRVIDVAISLESLLSSVTEIKFKFALFNSFITFSSPADREKAFELLQLLYDARSSIVHGDSKSAANRKKIDRLLENINEVFRIAQSAISYYIFFLYSRDPNSWQKHIEKLVLGTEKRLNQEKSNESQISEKKS